MAFPQNVQDLFNEVGNDYTALSDKDQTLMTAQTTVNDAQEKLNKAREGLSGPTADVFTAKNKLQTSITSLTDALHDLLNVPLGGTPPQTPPAPAESHVS